MVPQLGLGHDSHSCFHRSKEQSIPIPATESKEETERLKATLPRVLALDAKTCTVNEIVDAMKVADGVITRNAVGLDKFDLIESKSRLGFPAFNPSTSSHSKGLLCSEIEDIRPRLLWAGGFPKQTR